MKIHDIQTIHLSEGTIEDMIDALSAQGINNPKTIEKVFLKYPLVSVDFLSLFLNSNFYFI